MFNRMVMEDKEKQCGVMRRWGNDDAGVCLHDEFNLAGGAWGALYPLSFRWLLLHCFLATI
jgi:hypothetical protein